MHRIVKAEFLNDTVKRFEVEVPDIARSRKAGQFVIIRLGENGERVPLTIADSSSGAGTITLIVQEVGKTTFFMNKLEENDFIPDIVGPLGKPTHIENFGTAVCVGGGIGTAVVMPIAKALKEAGNKVISIIGFKSKDLLILENEINEISDEVIITTDDGSYGKKGFVTQPLQDMFGNCMKIGVVYAIGPMVMMHNVVMVTKPHNLLTYVSLNPIMVDGTGMCGGCRVTVDNQMKFACVDGPEFDGHKVDFEELIARLDTYKSMEKDSYSRIKEEYCKCES